MSDSTSTPGGPAKTPYREITPAAIIFGVLIGVVMNAAITYSGLKIGFTIGGSAIAAVLGEVRVDHLLGRLELDLLLERVLLHLPHHYTFVCPGHILRPGHKK